MEGRELAYYEMVNLEQADQSIKACLLDAGRNVIAVGYYLKVIRDRSCPGHACGQGEDGSPPSVGADRVVKAL